MHIMHTLFQVIFSKIISLHSLLKKCLENLSHANLYISFNQMSTKTLKLFANVATVSTGTVILARERFLCKDITREEK